MGYRTLDLATYPMWERQTGETRTSYERFRAYLGQPAEDRCVDQLARDQLLSGKALREQAERHRWRERADAFDEHERQRQRQQDRQRVEDLRVAACSAQLETARQLSQVIRAQAAHASGLVERPEWVGAEMARLAEASATLASVATATLPGPVDVERHD